VKSVREEEVKLRGSRICEIIPCRWQSATERRRTPTLDLKMMSTTAAG